MVCLNPPLSNVSSPRHRQFLRRTFIPIAEDVQCWRIHEGCVRAMTWDDEGTIATLGFWQSGDIVGAFPSWSIAFHLECLVNVCASPVSPDDIRESVLLMSHFDQAQQLLQITSHRRVENRLMNFLCWLASRFGHRVAEGYLVELRLTHQDVADTIRTTRVTVTRLLHQLQEEGKIVWRKQRCLLKEVPSSMMASGLY
jgi:Crp-like helix-turn-helix domain